MILVRIFAVVLAFLLAAWGLSSAALASSKDYCAAYAGQRATNKTGTEVPAGTIGNIEAAGTGTVIDEKWQGAYNQAFVSCMENYEPQPTTASADSAPKSSKPKVSSKPRQVKAAKSTRPAKRKNVAKTTKTTKTRKAMVSRSMPAAGPRRTRVVAKASDYCAGSGGKIASCRAKRTVPTSITMDPEKVGPGTKN